jgi:hypothetical protein
MSHVLSGALLVIVIALVVIHFSDIKNSRKTNG